MSVSLYDVSFGLFAKELVTLAGVLKAAEEHAISKGEDPNALVTAKLAEDMLPLKFQVQTVSNTIKKSVFRMTGGGEEPWADEEATMAELQARVAKTQELVRSVQPAAVNAMASKQVEMQFGKGTSFPMSALDYITDYALPNSFFHLSMAYSILRAQGVPLGKRTYLSGFMATHHAKMTPPPS
jgi:hypothetical protein